MFFKDVFMRMPICELGYECICMAVCLSLCLCGAEGGFSLILCLAAQRLEYRRRINCNT